MQNISIDKKYNEVNLHKQTNLVQLLRSIKWKILVYFFLTPRLIWNTFLLSHLELSVSLSLSYSKISRFQLCRISIIGFSNANELDKGIKELVMGI